MRLFPDHWEKKAMAIMTRRRLLFPGVFTSVSQPTAAASLSMAMAVRISSNSYSTRGCFLRRSSASVCDQVTKYSLVAIAVVVGEDVESLFLSTYTAVV